MTSEMKTAMHNIVACLHSEINICAGVPMVIPCVVSGTCVYLILCMSVCGSLGMLPWLHKSGVVASLETRTRVVSRVGDSLETHLVCKMKGIGLILFLLHLLTLPEAVEAYVRSAHEGHFPYVWDTGSLRPVVWVRGSMLQRVIGASAVRITDNRMRFIPAAWTLTTTGSYATESTSCIPHAFALCSVSGTELRGIFGMGTGSLVFPTAAMGVRVHGNTSHSCKNGIGRISQASDMVEPIYDVSVCDVVDGPLDILFVHDRVSPAYRILFQYPELFESVLH